MTEPRPIPAGPNVEAFARASRPTDADAFGDLPSPDEYAANGYSLTPRSRYDRAMGTWRNAHKPAIYAALAVTDTSVVVADALLVGGTWLEGPFEPVWAGLNAMEHTGWLSADGVHVDVLQVQARRIGGQHRADWLAHLEARPVEDCPGAGELALRPDPTGERGPDGFTRDVAAEPGSTAYCAECDHSVAVIGADGGEPVLAPHDRRGTVTPA